MVTKPASPFVCLCVSAALVGCGSRRVRTDLPREERGVAVLTEIVLEYKDALRARDFEEAEDLLEELEDGVAGADGITRSHPDFEDVALAAQKARPAFERMVRKDKIEKLIARMQTEIADAEQLSEQLDRAGPSSRRVGGLRDASRALEEMLAEGESYQDDKTYAGVAPGFAERLGRYQAQVAEYGWILRLMDELGPRLEAAVRAEEIVASAAPAAERLQAGHDAVAAFGDCRALTTAYREEPGYSDTLKIQTAIGEVSIDEAGLTCEFRRVAAQNRVATLEWELEIRAVTDQVTAALNQLAGADGPDAALAVTGEALEALAECTRALRKTDEHAGFDSAVKFETPLGRLNALRLREACRSEGERIGSKNPTLQWKSGLARLRKRAGDARAEAAAAKRAESVEDKVTHLSAAVGGFQECMEQARFLGLGKGVRGAKPSARDKAEVKRLGTSCRKQHGRAARLLKKAKRAAVRRRGR